MKIVQMYVNISMISNIFGLFNFKLILNKNWAV